jgi:hypothetical protein
MAQLCMQYVCLLMPKTKLLPVAASIAGSKQAVPAI